MGQLRLSQSAALNVYIRLRAAVYQRLNLKYTQPWFLRPGASENARLLRVAVNICILAVALPMTLAWAEKRKNKQPESDEEKWHKVLMQLEDEAVLSRLNSERKQQGAPPVPFLLDSHGQPVIVAACDAMDLRAERVVEAPRAAAADLWDKVEQAAVLARQQAVLQAARS